MQSQENQNNRRNFLRGGVGIFAGGLATSGLIGSSLSSKEAQGQTGNSNLPTWPWPYMELIPEMAADMGYEGFYEGACCYGTFKGLVGQWAEVYGAPFTYIPLDMMKYGEGGVAGWGSVCGTINAASAAINLVCSMEDARKLINELVAWYSATALPTYIPSGKESIVTNISDSPLCHVSVSKWCKVANAGVSTPERKERCARLVADVAKKTSILLNEHYKGTFESQNSPAASVSECMSCHGSSAKNNTLGKMDCVSCHEPANHPLPISSWKEF